MTYAGTPRSECAPMTRDSIEAAAPRYTGMMTPPEVEQDAARARLAIADAMGWPRPVGYVLTTGKYGRVIAGVAKDLNLTEDHIGGISRTWAGAWAGHQLRVTCLTGEGS